MKKYVGLILVAVVISTLMTPVFAIRMIDFIRSRNEAAKVITGTVMTSTVVTSTITATTVDWSKPYYAIAKFKISDGTLDHIKIDGFEASNISYTKFNGWLWIKEGVTKWYHEPGFYVKGYLTTGDEFFMSIVPLDITVKTYEFNKNRIYFNAQNVEVFFINYHTGERFTKNMDTIRFDVRFSDDKVNMAGGNGSEFADNVIRISDMTLLPGYSYQCYYSFWCP